MNFAKNLSEARKAKKMSRKELADKVMRSQSAIKSWEIGRHIPPDNVQRKIESVLGLVSGALVADYDKDLMDVLMRFNAMAQTVDELKKARMVALLESLIVLMDD